MRLQPNRSYTSDDVVQTPLKLARQLVAHFNPQGRILEPCKGKGNFLRALREHVSGNAETLKAEMLKSVGARQGRSAVGGQKSEVSARSLGGQKVEMLTGDGAGETAQVISDFKTPAASTVAWCEIQQGRDFFEWSEKVDWIVTNPPWSQIRRFLQHAMSVADNVVFLMTINHVWTKARLRDIREAGFGLKEIVLVDMPKTFPQSGFQLGAVYVRKKWTRQITLGEIASNR